MRLLGLPILLASLALVASMHPSVLTFWRDPKPPASGVAAWERQKTEVFTSNNNAVKWNASVGKKFLKKSEL